MTVRARRLERVALRLFDAADAAFNALYGWRFNPLYQSGTIVIALLLILLVTGLWLIFFYRVGSPYESVARITADPWIGNWMRGAHRYASDAAVIATIVHALRMFAQGRSWGPRTLAWLTGIGLLVLMFLCGWTGYVMVWDAFGEVLAREGARLLDALPVLSEPVSRTFTGERPIASIFFFLNLFAHVGIPLGILLALWLHVSRVARPTLLPPRPLVWGLAIAFVALALVRPIGMGDEANPFRLPETVPVDVVYAFWLPLSRALTPGTALAGAAAATALLLAVPLFVKRRAGAAPAPSVVDEDICTGCRQCALDCPYEAIEMLPRHDGRADEVARVTPDRCVSCGICAGSCAPMGVGPPERTGRDQLSRVRLFLNSPERRAGEIVAICCDRVQPRLDGTGVTVYPVDCAGSLHTSVIEMMIRRGVGGVVVSTCAPRDCWNREGPRWLTERVYHDREAELQARVDRRRLRLVSAGPGERNGVRAAVAALAAEIASLEKPVAEPVVVIDAECDPPPPPPPPRPEAS